MGLDGPIPYFRKKYRPVHHSSATRIVGFRPKRTVAFETKWQILELERSFVF